MQSVRTAGIALLGLFFIAAGANHFVHPHFYVRMVPQWLPSAAALVVVSGAAEILGGIGVLIPVTRRAAAFGLIVLLVAVFPANVQMALHPELFRDVGTETAFLIRLPIQLLIGTWVWWACLRSP